VRVLHVLATGERRGAEIFASDLVRSLNEEGVAQRVAVLRGGVPPAVPFEVPTSLLGLNGLRLPGLRIDLRALWRLRRLIWEWRPDILQAHGGEALKYAVVPPLGPSPPVVYRRIGGTHHLLARGWRRAGYGGLIRQAAQVVAVSEVVRRETVKMFRVPESRVATIPNAVDRQRMEPARSREMTRRALGVPASAGLVLSVGALTWEKDPLAQIGVAARVAKKRPDAYFLMVGDGPMRGQVEEAIRETSLRARVWLLGSRTDVPDLLAASDVLLLTSRTEGMPAVVIEAGMAGLPVVAYAVSGVPEVVVQRGTGLLSPPGQEERLAANVVELLEDERTRRKLGSAGRDRCRGRYEIGVVAPAYLDLYRDLAPHRGEHLR
jgi:glycosyltransferase involved in cell wall biosynthesis